MAGLERVMVGYRAHDRRRLMLIDQYGVQSVAVRNCVADCGYPVYFNASGIASMHGNGGSEVVCQECADRYMLDIRDEL